MDIRVKDIIKDNSIWLPSQDYNEKKKLSILMPTYGNGENGFFKRAVTSYIEQTFKDTELIIIDDANTDGTSEQIDEFMKQDRRISCIRHKQNMGLPAISMYEAVKKARGEYIGFLFDDCILYPTAYERTLKKMEEEGAQASYGRVLVQTNKDDLSKTKTIYYKEEYLDNLEISNSIGNIAIIFKKDILETVGYLDPHVCLSRVNDWDFITRVKRKFHLIETGVLFAKEYGVTQSNSLENLLAVDEYLKVPNREKRLLLDEYEEINIFSKEDNSSYNFSSEIRKSLDFFKNKYWLSELKNNYKEPNFFDDNVAILCSGPITSSISLLFSRNCSDSTQNMFSYINADKNIAKSRAVILVRETNMKSDLLKKLEYAEIPTYLLWDDDFLLLSKEKILNLNITENDFKKVAKQLNGLIFTSKNFCQTYKDKGYNPNNYLVNPVYLDKLEKEISLIENNQLNIAFTGGLWRIKEFLKTLIDILNNICKEKKVTLYLLKDKDLENFFNENKINFSIKWYDITLSYDQLINKLSNKNIHIVIHPAQELSNNVNKTKNALVTASLLGAALITTDGAPYNVKDSEDDPMPYLLASNEEKYWVEAIKKMLDDKARIEIVKKARDYCKKRYSARCLDELIKDILEKTPKLDINLYSERLEKLAYFSGKMQRSGNFNQIMVDGIGEDIIATKKIDKKLKTFFVANKNNFSTISMIFGTHQRSPQGTCKIKVFDEKNTKIHDEIISLDEVSDNKFYNINLEYIENTMGKKFYISFEFSYINKNKVSVYERNYKYSNNKLIRNLIRPFRKNEIYVSLS
jgi:hypothetical protein